MHDQFLTEAYETELLKVLRAWNMFKPEDIPFRPHPTDPRGRSVHEHMVHQCVSEDFWFRTMLGIDVGIPSMPAVETRLEFIRSYAVSSSARLAMLHGKSNDRWEQEVEFFEAMRQQCGGHAFLSQSGFRLRSFA
jgi:hypothetical protein